MAREEFQYTGTKTLRERALDLPGVSEGDSCVKRAFRARTKGFLYLGEKDDSYNVMLKVGDSAEVARTFCAEDPERRSLGSTNWLTVHLDPDQDPPEVLARWVEESYRLLAPKKLVAQLEEEDPSWQRSSS